MSDPPVVKLVTASESPKGHRKPSQPNPRPPDVREWVRRSLEDPQGRGRLLRAARRGKLSPAVFIELINLAYGLPVTCPPRSRTQN